MTEKELKELEDSFFEDSIKAVDEKLEKEMREKDDFVKNNLEDMKLISKAQEEIELKAKAKEEAYQKKRELGKFNIDKLVEKKLLFKQDNKLYAKYELFLNKHIEFCFMDGHEDKIIPILKLHKGLGLEVQSNGEYEEVYPRSTIVLEDGNKFQIQDIINIANQAQYTTEFEIEINKLRMWFDFW